MTCPGLTNSSGTVVPLMETEVPPRETGSGVVENWALAAARLEPKTVMSAPGAMAGRKLAALRMPSAVGAGVGRAMVKVRALDGPPSLSTLTVSTFYMIAQMVGAGALVKLLLQLVCQYGMGDVAA